MGCSELSVPMNKNFGPEHKIQIPYIHYLKNLGKNSIVCNEKYSELVSK